MFMRYEWGLAVGHTYTHRLAVAVNLDVLARQKARSTSSSRGEGREAMDTGTIGNSGEGGGDGGDGDEREGEDGWYHDEDDGDAYGSDWDEDRDFAKGYESEDEREYLAFG